MLKYFMFLISVIVSSLILYYLKQLENIGCKCALNFKHDYIFYFTIVNLCYVIVNATIGYLPVVKMIQLIIGIPIFIASIANLIFTIQYIDDLRQKKCDCSESIIREGMYILAIINLCAMIIIILFMSMLIIQSPDIFKKVLLKKKMWNNYITTGKFVNKSTI
jgi:hypothetical protein